MRYESAYHNVTTYPRRFQNWINGNLDLVAQHMQILLCLNVSEIGPAKRIVRNVTQTAIQSVMSPSVSSAAPSVSPTHNNNINDAVPTEQKSVPSTTLPPPPLLTDFFSPNKQRQRQPIDRHVIDVIVISASVVIGVLTLAIGLVVRYGKRRKTTRRRHPRDEVSSLEFRRTNSAATATENNNNEFNRRQRSGQSGTTTTMAATRNWGGTYSTAAISALSFPSSEEEDDP